MTLEEIVSPAPKVSGPGVETRPSVIEVSHLSKAFEIPLERVDSIKERVAHPFRQPRVRNLQALDDISFEVHRGEFFGIVGRNGTGKSTLLKILASIYRADSGRIRMAGRVAPFIELGVGFNVELTARENIVLNGVLMGLSLEEARGRIDAVIEFAELDEFADLKLKNYSSGMLVRLAFSVMIQSDADILLIDEVLAVGDASFQQKCRDVFHEIRGSGRTVVLVTHDMGAVEQFCHRAMLLHGGDIVEIGDPDTVAKRYLRLNFAQPGGAGHPVDQAGDLVLIDAWLQRPDGERTANLPQGEAVEFRAEFEARAEIPNPSFGFVIANEDGVEVSGVGLGLNADHTGAVAPGEKISIRAKLENRLAPGRYAVQAWIYRNHSLADPVLASPRILDFVVFGTDHAVGLVALVDDAEIEVSK